MEVEVVGGQGETRRLLRAALLSCDIVIVASRCVALRCVALVELGYGRKRRCAPQEEKLQLMSDGHGAPPGRACPIKKSVKV